VGPTAMSHVWWRSARRLRSAIGHRVGRSHALVIAHRRRELVITIRHFDMGSPRTGMGSTHGSGTFLSRAAHEIGTITFHRGFPPGNRPPNFYSWKTIRFH